MRKQFKDWVIPASVGVASFGLGAAVGYILSKRKIGDIDSKIDSKFSEVEETFESQIVQLAFCFEERDHKIDSFLQQASHIVKKTKDEGQEFLNKSTAQHVEKSVVDNHPSNGKPEQRSITLSPVANKDDTSLVVNVFQDEDDDDWDYEAEEHNRGQDHPYIIHRDEYDENEDDYSQTTLTYYSGDNILCDEHDVPIYNPEKLVGRIEFGHGSRDPNICYIRNDHLGSDFEILFDPGAFQSEVLGQQPEDLRHSYHPVPKFRME